MISKNIMNSDSSETYSLKINESNVAANVTYLSYC